METKSFINLSMSIDYTTRQLFNGNLTTEHVLLEPSLCAFTISSGWIFDKL